MTKKRKYKRFVRGLLIALAAFLLVGFIGTMVVRNFLQQNQISYISLRYHFPSAITLEGLQIRQEPELTAEIALIDLEWSWGSVIRRRPEITHLQMEGGELEWRSTVNARDSTGRQAITLPRISLREGRLHQLSATVYTPGDSIELQLETLFIHSVQLGDEVIIDSVRLEESCLSYRYPLEEGAGTEKTEFESPGPFPLGEFPEIELNQLGLQNCELLISDGATPHHINRLDLEISGWKKSDLLDLQIGRLGFIYQDTLEVDLILENGRVNSAFQTQLRDFAIGIPGAFLDLTTADARLDEGVMLSLEVAESYVTLKRIRQLYPEISSIIHEDLPGSTRFRFSGDLLLDQGEISLRSFRLDLMDSTLAVINGSVHLREEVKMEMEVQPLQTSRSNLVDLLAPQDYHRFYHWPTEISGRAGISGGSGQLDIRGLLETRQGDIRVSTTTGIHSSGTPYFVLDLEGDSLLVDQITPILPVPVPMGQIHFYLEQSQAGPGDTGSLLIRIESDRLFPSGMEIQKVAFTYLAKEPGDSILVSVNDEELQLDAALFLPGEDTGDMHVSATLAHFHPKGLKPDWPSGSYSTEIKGSVHAIEEQVRADIEISSLQVETGGQTIELPDSRILADVDSNDLAFDLRTDSGSVIRARTGTSFPEFHMPLPAWFSRWPDTDIQVGWEVDEELFHSLTGSTGSLDLHRLQLKKDSTGWTATVHVPKLLFEDFIVEELSIDLFSRDAVLSGLLAIESLSHSNVSMDSIYARIGYEDLQYKLALGNTMRATGRPTHLSTIIQEKDASFLVKLNEEEPLILDGTPWRVELNDGVMLSNGMKLRQGDLAISSNGSRLEIRSEEEMIRLQVDSLPLTPWMAYLSPEETVSGTLSGTAELNISNGNANWDAYIDALLGYIDDSLEISISGIRQEQDLSMLLDLAREDLSLRAEVESENGGLTYEASLDHLDLQALESIPGWPEEVRGSGKISGQVGGSLTPTLNAAGFLVMDDLHILHPYTSEPLTIERDTLFLAENQIVLRNLDLTDAAGDELVLDGSIQYSPDLGFELEISGDSIALLSRQEKDGPVSGELNTSTLLKVSGTRDGIMVNGAINTIPGATIHYINQESFNMVDASQVVTFMEIGEKEGTYLPRQSGTGLKMNWNVDLSVDQTEMEVLLDPISQEYIRIVGSGDLLLRSGLDKKPLVYGTINSNSGSAYIKPPAIPELNLIIENASISWNGLLDEPVFSFRGYEMVKSGINGLSTQFSDRTDLVDYKVIVILDEVTLEEFDIRFDLEVMDSEAQVLLASLPEDTRQTYAMNLLVFGRIGSEKITSNAMLAGQVTKKLNELARRNFKNSGLTFSSSSYRIGTEGINDRSRTDLSYSLSRGFMNNRLSFSVGGSVGVYMDDMTVLPPSSLIGDLEMKYRISDKPFLEIRGARKNVYEGIIDGMVMEESLGIYLQKSYPRFPVSFNKTKRTPSE